MTYQHYRYYADNWRAATSSCGCGWTNAAGDVVLEPFDAVAEIHCPACDAKLGLLSYPTLEEIQAAAEAGFDEAKHELARIEARRRNQR